MNPLRSLPARPTRVVAGARTLLPATLYPMVLIDGRQANAPWGRAVRIGQPNEAAGEVGSPDVKVISN